MARTKSGKQMNLIDIFHSSQRLKICKLREHGERNCSQISNSFSNQFSGEILCSGILQRISAKITAKISASFEMLSGRVLSTYRFLGQKFESSKKEFTPHHSIEMNIVIFNWIIESVLGLSRAIRTIFYDELLLKCTNLQVA